MRRNKVSYVDSYALKDLEQAEERLKEAVKNGFDFKLHCSDGKEIRLNTFMGIAAWLCEKRKYIPTKYDFATEYAISYKAKELIKTCTSSKSMQRKKFYKFVMACLDEYDITEMALMITMFDMRFKLPLQGNNVLKAVVYALLQTHILTDGYTGVIAPTISELFCEKTIKCVHEFVTRCLEGESWSDAQSSLNTGAFKIMTLEEDKSRHLSKRGRQCMRLIASVLYCVFAQNEILACDYMFKNMDLKELFKYTGVGRIEWMYDFLTKSEDFSDYENLKYLGLCCLDCEPKGLTVKLNDKRLKEVGTYRSIFRLTDSIYTSVESLIIEVFMFFAHESCNEDNKKYFDEEIQKLKDSNYSKETTLNKALKESKESVRNLTKQIGTLSSDCSVLVNENMSLKDELERINSAEVLKQKDEEILSLRGKLTDVESERDTLAAKLEVLQNKITGMETRKVKAKDNEEELSILHNRVSELEELVSVLESETLGHEVTMEDVSNFCRDIKPCVFGAVKNFDKVLGKVFKDFIYKDVDDTNLTVLPSKIDCILIYTRRINHADVAAIFANAPASVPIIYIKNTNQDLIRKEVYRALYNKDKH